MASEFRRKLLSDTWHLCSSSQWATDRFIQVRSIQKMRPFVTNVAPIEKAANAHPGCDRFRHLTPLKKS